MTPGSSLTPAPAAPADVGSGMREALSLGSHHRGSPAFQQKPSLVRWLQMLAWFRKVWSYPWKGSYALWKSTSLVRPLFNTDSLKEPAWGCG